MTHAVPPRAGSTVGRAAAAAAALLLVVGSIPPPAAAEDAGPPTIADLVMTPGTVGPGPLLVTATASDDTGVAQAQVQVDGGAWALMAPGDAAYGATSVAVSALLNADVRQVSTNGPTTCAVLANGALLCWGSNAHGELGMGTKSSAPTPIAAVAAGIDGSSRAATALRVGVGAEFVCVSLADATIRCWGSGSYGQLGNGANAESLTPVVVSGVVGGAGVDLAVGYSHACAAQGDGTSVKCWGTGWNGELGNGAGASSATPVVVSGIDGATPARTVTQVAAGYYATCARMANGAAMCWGRNYEGQAGNTSAPQFVLSPSPVVGIDGSTTATSARSVAVGFEFACAVMASATVAGGGGAKCWGSGAGVDALGRGGVPGDSRLPAPVFGLDGATEATAVAGIALGSSQACAFTVAGTPVCWGNNSYGQLGTGGSPVNSNRPLEVSGLAGAVVAPAVASVDAGANVSCVTDGAGTLRCWGWNPSGGLGDGTVDTRTSPVVLRGVGGRLADGDHEVCVRAVDAAANVSEPVCSTAHVDRVAPTATAPTATVRTGVPLSGTSVSMAVAWSGADDIDGSGVARFELERSVSGRAWTPISTSLATPSANVTVASSGTVRFRARTIDKAGNASEWATGPTLTVRLTQQNSTAVKYSGTWTSTSSSAYSGGSAKYASVAGRSASYTFTGRSIALVTTMARTRGSVKIYLSGRLVKTASLYSSSTKYRMVVWQAWWPTSASRTVKLVVVGTRGRPRVDLDAFVVVK